MSPMQVTLTITDPAILRGLADLMEQANKAPVSKSAKEEKAVEPKKEKAAKKTKAAPVVEETEEDEDEPSFEDDESEEMEEESEQEEETEEDEDEPSFEDDESEEDEDEAPKSKAKSGKVAPKAAPKTAAKPSTPALKYEDIQAAFRTTHAKLEKKFKSKEKALQALNKFLKKIGAKSTRTIEQAKYAMVIKELKAMAA